MKPTQVTMWPLLILYLPPYRPRRRFLLLPSHKVEPSIIKYMSDVLKIKIWRGFHGFLSRHWRLLQHRWHWSILCRSKTDRKTMRKKTSPTIYSFRSTLSTSKGITQLRFPIPDEKVIHSDADDFNSDIPLLICLDIMKTQGLIIDYNENLFINPSYCWSL